MFARASDHCANNGADLNYGDRRAPATHMLSSFLTCPKASPRWRSKSRREMLLLGGEPFGERILMRWNFIGRKPEEMRKPATTGNKGIRLGGLRGRPHSGATLVITSVAVGRRHRIGIGGESCRKSGW